MAAESSPPLEAKHDITPSGSIREYCPDCGEKLPDTKPAYGNPVPSLHKCSPTRQKTTQESSWDRSYSGNVDKKKPENDPKKTN
jgi:hypothetical protein